MLFSSSITCFGQSKPPIKKNIIDITLGGTGIFASINYSRVLLAKENYFINTSLGIGTVASGATIPHQLTINLGKQSSFFETGIGGILWSGTDTSSSRINTKNSYNLSPILGWRKYTKSNLVFRIYANPIFNISGDLVYGNNKVLPFGGISLGYSF